MIYLLLQMMISISCIKRKQNSTRKFPNFLLFFFLDFLTFILTFCWIFLNHWFCLYWNFVEIDLSAKRESRERKRKIKQKVNFWILEWKTKKNCLIKRIYFFFSKGNTKNLYKWNTCVILKEYERNEMMPALKYMTEADAGRLWKWLQALGTQPLRPYAPRGPVKAQWRVPSRCGPLPCETCCGIGVTL